MEEQWSKHQCHEMLTLSQRYIKRTSVQSSITSETPIWVVFVAHQKMCCLFHRGQPWDFGAGLSLWHTGDLLPREPLASSSSYVENCLGNSHKKEEELKKLNSLDFASGLQQLGQWMLPSSMAAVGTELCWEELQQALSQSLWITASGNCCSPRMLHVLLSCPMPCLFLWHRKARK